LENNHLQGKGTYPRTISAAFSLLTNWKQDPRNLVQSVMDTTDGISFANLEHSSLTRSHNEDINLTNNGIQAAFRQKKGKKMDMSKYICRRCGKPGHYLSECDGERINSHTTITTDDSSLTRSTRQTGSTMLTSGTTDDNDECQTTTGFQLMASVRQRQFYKHQHSTGTQRLCLTIGSYWTASQPLTFSTTTNSCAMSECHQHRWIYTVTQERHQQILLVTYRDMALCGTTQKASQTSYHWQRCKIMGTRSATAPN
jgi:hypothetical protein